MQTLSAHTQLKIVNARQNNLKNVNINIDLGKITVFTGVSGSGKSSLVFDTLYAEGQRRYVETFSAYARQFLDRMDKPAVDKVDGVPPAIAIAQNNPVRSSRSTVGTMTELNDHLKLLFTQLGRLYDAQTAQPVQQDNTDSVLAQLLQRLNDSPPSTEIPQRLIVTFTTSMPGNTPADQVEAWLSVSGFTKTHGTRWVDVPLVSAEAGDTKPTTNKKTPAKASKTTNTSKSADTAEASERAENFDHAHQRLEVTVVVDRFKTSGIDEARLRQALETAFAFGHGHLTVYVVSAEDVENQQLGQPWAFSKHLHCPESGATYLAAAPALFSFNSPLGACETCRGFGRVIGVDYDLVIPNPKLTLRAGAVKPFQTPAWQDCQDDLMHHAELQGVPRDTAWNQLTPEHQRWVIHGQDGYREGREGAWSKKWYGIKRYFAYLEGKAYKMHIRVLLSKYRSYTACEDCGGARLKTQGLLWRVGSAEAAAEALAGKPYFIPVGANAEKWAHWQQNALQAPPGLGLHDLMQLPLAQLAAFCERVRTDNAVAAAANPGLKLILDEVCKRAQYLCDVGLSYLTLDRQSRTLSGGEVQRINLTTALGSSLVNTLFVLDEPSIGLHPRDIDRIATAMLRLRDAGNTLVVVEHDPALMRIADRVVDVGPGPGAAGGHIVFDGSFEAIKNSDTLTGAYLGGRKHISLTHTARAVAENQPKLLLQNARAHNVQGLDLEIPLGCMVALTGVSGSGKSTLVQGILAPALLRHFGKTADTPLPHDALLGADWLGDVVFVDQSPIGKTARSNPASYVGAWDAVRELFAQTPLARERGWSASKFSFNSGDGRCPLCSGAGFEHVEMQFLSDVYLRCQACNGSRYRADTLEVALELGGKSYHAAQVLDLTVREALALFEHEYAVCRALKPLVEVGLEYLKLGQSVPTLSGGEAQRLKLAGFLAEKGKGSAKTAKSSKVSKASIKAKPLKATASGQKLAVKPTHPSKGTLYLFDEPTTGLHFDDIAKLLKALRRLVDDGHSVLVIEHNLDLIRHSDWLIDLGPEAGAGGGQLVAQGPPQQVMARGVGHTAQALMDYELQALAQHKASNQVRDSAVGFAPPPPKPQALKAPAPQAIQIRHAREHNLKNLSLDIPRGKFNVITGVSGSGKSTLAFDIVFNEGQRRYLESLNAYARSIVAPAARPDVDAVYGIPPSVAIEQRQSRGGRKSTVGTLTEVWHYLRLLFVRLGVQHCVHDGTAVQPQSAEQIAAQLMREHRGAHIGLLAPLVQGRKGIYTELAAQYAKAGYTHLRVNGAFVSTAQFPKLDRFKEHHIELPVADLVCDPQHEKALQAAVHKAVDIGKGVLFLLPDLSGLTGPKSADEPQEPAEAPYIGAARVFSTQRACPACHTSYAELDPRLFSYNSRHGWCTECVGTGLALDKTQRRALDDTLIAPEARGQEQSFAEVEVEGLSDAPCPSCHGTRLNAQARAVHFAGATITQLGQRSIEDLQQWAEQLQASGEQQLDIRQAQIARDVLPEIAQRLAFLSQVGLGYLSLDRAAPTLSGGEAQRIRLAAQLGSSLQGVCYVLDEPSIGLHPRDNHVLLASLKNLVAQGNTLLVVEHDLDTIKAADHIVDIGPGAGKRGGQLVAQGSAADVAAAPDSLTGRYLRQAMQHPLLPPDQRLPAPTPQDPWLQLGGVSRHNVQGVSLRLPLQRLVAITGVSGSGKSTLAREVLLPNVLAQVQAPKPKTFAAKAPQTKDDSTFSSHEPDYLSNGQPPALYCSQITGAEHIDRVLEVDQTPIGKTPRSCPATYIGFWDEIRKLYAQTLEAKVRGYLPNRFSFNTGPGRCPQCEGAGLRTVSMSFLPESKVVCELCHGARFNLDTLSVLWRGKSIGDVLQMEVDEALPFFATSPAIAHPLQLMQDVGLGYLTLGQPSPTLSGGEAQRIKLVSELVKVRDEVGRRGQKAPHTLYVLDEPTVGLHMADVEKLIHVLHRLVRGGHSVVVIEHDLDLIAEADWVVDLGPEGGKGGGQIVAQGVLAEVLRSDTHTARALRGMGLIS